VPLFANQGLGVAVSSYEEKLCWGCNADWDTVPDLDYFMRMLARSFRELRDAAGVNKKPAKKPTPGNRKTKAEAPNTTEPPVETGTVQ